ncbi:MAG: hypothetical protein IPJ60_18710 [Sphingobacteriaceae bacterium]|nr:hypothetical protein [Sphingobacteriaceae bacterium]
MPPKSIKIIFHSALVPLVQNYEGLKKKKLSLRIKYKTQNITEEQTDEMHKMSNIPALFSKVALKFRAWGLKRMELTGQDYRKQSCRNTLLRSDLFLSSVKISWVMLKTVGGSVRVKILGF